MPLSQFTIYCHPACDYAFATTGNDSIFCRRWTPEAEFRAMKKKNDITCVYQCSQWRRLAEVSRFQSRPRKADQTHWSKVSFWVEALENCCSSGTGQKNATEPIERWHFWSQNSGTVLQSAPVAKVSVA